MANKLTRSLIAGLAMMACGSSALMAAQVYHPDESQTTTLTATVAEQANITVPSSVTWNVTDVASSTDSTGQTITVTDIVLASDTKHQLLCGGR